MSDLEKMGKIMDDVRNIQRAFSDAERLYALLWAAGVELNAIAARDGAPANVDPGYFGRLVDAIRRELGGDIKPWPEPFMRNKLLALGLASPQELQDAPNAPEGHDTTPGTQRPFSGA